MEIIFFEIKYGYQFCHVKWVCNIIEEYNYNNRNADKKKFILFC